MLRGLFTMAGVEWDAEVLKCNAYMSDSDYLAIFVVLLVNNIVIGID